MAAMESSTKNAKEMLGKLTLSYNRCACLGSLDLTASDLPKCLRPGQLMPLLCRAGPDKRASQQSSQKSSVAQLRSRARASKSDDSCITDCLLASLAGFCFKQLIFQSLRLRGVGHLSPFGLRYYKHMDYKGSLMSEL